MPWQPIAAALAGLILIAAFIRQVVVPVARLVRAAVRLADLHPQMIKVVEQLGPNGGQSMFDKVDDMHRMMFQHEVRISELEADPTRRSL